MECWKIIVKSSDNSDWNGEWTKVEVEKDMVECGQIIMAAAASSWLYMVIRQLFSDCVEFDVELARAICEESPIRKLVLAFEDCLVTVEKVY